MRICGTVSAAIAHALMPARTPTIRNGGGQPVQPGRPACSRIFRNLGNRPPPCQNPYSLNLGKNRVCSKEIGLLLVMGGPCGELSGSCHARWLVVALEVQGHPSLQRLLGAYPIDGLLHLPVTAIAARRRWRSRVVTYRPRRSAPSPDWAKTTCPGSFPGCGNAARAGVTCSTCPGRCPFGSGGRTGGTLHP